MEFKGKIAGLEINYFTSKPKIVIDCEDVNLAEIEELKDCDIRCTIKRYRNKRSNDANAYFWVLANKLAAKLKVPKQDIYRQYIKDIGDNYDLVCVPNESVERLTRGWSEHGLGWVTETTGSEYEGYTNVFLYYGSSTYDTAQMSRLIDLVVFDCKQQNISVLTPEEIEMLKSRWGDEI